MTRSEQDEALRGVARQPSLIEFFEITGLFGYRTVGLSSSNAASILIARNGSGKTTLLAALDAFLRGQFSRFAGLQFERITCVLRGNNPMVLYRDDVDKLTELSANSEFVVRAKAWEVEPLALLELLETNLKDLKFAELAENPTFYAIYSKLGYDFSVARSQCERLAQSMRGKSPNIDWLRDSLRQSLQGFEIVYLPTYRRIELSLPDSETRPGQRRKNILARLGIARSGLYTADIQFGLGDISARLKTLYSDMRYLSNQGYGKISANVINDLISGGYKQDDDKAYDLPSKDSLEIFFSRLKDGEDAYRNVRYGSYFATPDLSKVYSDDVPNDARPFLEYFLHQLNSVIKETRGTEDLVEAFRSSCNKYLSGDDESTDQYGNSTEDEFDNKVLDFNRRNLTVKVMGSASGKEVPLESLSSGEKQMISLFARLYLYPGDKIVLIDEPELSLSLDWQRQILPDVLTAPTCRQLIAITHSPFIFDNALEDFAGPLRLRVNPMSGPDMFGASAFDQMDEDGDDPS
ncbi:AAA family ATPase [Aquincola tertiaricarbonis]|uniref:AAA family ATPase n=1 Tax=Aquincola tertiaricarbonis TaxID=391953 RepID=UPI0009FA775A|nr:AAA family ATPase [Aquincola tertiaricarbonis]